MKFNWGHGIFVFFTIFVIIMLSVLYLSRQQNIDLVTEDYYAAELVYQDKIDQLNNSKSKGFEVKHRIEGKELILEFSKSIDEGKVQNGEVYFYRPSDASFDYTQALTLDGQNELRIAENSLNPGYYIMKISFSIDNEKYYIEKGIMI